MTRSSHQTITGKSGRRESHGDGTTEARVIRTVVFAVPTNTETSGLYGGEAQAYRLAEGGGVDVRDAIFITDTAIRIVQSLSGDVPILVGRVIGVEPGLSVVNVTKVD